MRNLLNISLLSLFFCLINTGIGHAKLYLSLYATGGVHDFATEQNLESDPLTGLKVSLDFEGGKEAHDFSLEGTFNQFSVTNLTDDSTVDATVARVDVIYPLLQKTKWRPFLTVGIGRLLFEGDDNRPQDEDIVAYGVGLKYLLTEYLTLRAEGRHELLFNRENGNIDNYEYTASIGYTFGKRKPKKKKPKPKVEPKPEPKPEPKKPSDDDDQDGIKNPVDRCPGTPAGIKVDSTGCAEQTPGRPESFIEESVPAEESQPMPVEKPVVATARPVETPVVKKTTTLQKEVVREEPKPVIEQEETPPAYVLPKLPTVIAIPTLPEEKQTVAVETPQPTEPPQAPVAGTGSAVTNTLKTIAAIPALPVAAVVAAADALIDNGKTPSAQTEDISSKPSETAGAEPIQSKAAVPAKPETAPTIAAESTAIPPAPQQPVPATVPPVAVGPETLATADVTTPAIVDAQESPALPTTEPLPEPIPVPTVAVATEPPTTVEAPKDVPGVVASAESPKDEVIAEVIIPTAPLPVAPVVIPPVTVVSQSVAPEKSAAADDEIQVAETEKATPPTDSVPEPVAEPLIAAAPTGPAAQPVPEATPLEIPQCSGLPPHAILMLGKAGSELLHVPVDEVTNQPEPYRADQNVAKKSHVPTASFEFDVWQLTDQAKQVLTLLVKQLERSGLEYKLRVEGHTDSVGSETYNYKLSLLRANAVASFLENEKGVDPSKLAIAGCGEWKPLASNETDEGRTLNRRFELVILPGDSQ